MHLCDMQAVTAARSMVDDYMAMLQTRSMAALNSGARPPPVGAGVPADNISLPADAAPGAESPGAITAAGAKSAVDSYLANLRSRSIAAGRSRGGDEGPPVLGGHAAVAASLCADSRSTMPSPAAAQTAASSGTSGSGDNTGSDARAVVDSYMSSLRQRSAAVGRERASGSGAAAKGSTPSVELGSVPAPAEDANAAVANYMKSLRRQSVAAAATEAARRSSQDCNAEVVAAAAAATAEQGSAATGRPAAADTETQRSVPSPPPADSMSMREAREAVAAHMATLRKHSAGVRESAALRGAAHVGGGLTTAPLPLAAVSSGSKPAPAASDTQVAHTSTPAAIAAPTADDVPADSRPPVETAQATVDSYIESLRRTSTKLGTRSGGEQCTGSTGSPDLRALAAASLTSPPRPPSSKRSSNGSDGSGSGSGGSHKDACNAIANYMEVWRSEL